MSRNQYLGLGLLGLSLLLALGTAAFMILFGARVPPAIFAWPGLGFILGLALFLFSFIETGLAIDDEIEDFPHLVEDDLQHMRSGTLTPALIFTVVTILAIGAEFGLLLWYRKDLAAWGPINVLLVALFVVVGALVWSLRTSWFQVRRQRLTPRVFLIPAAGWLICLIIGINYAEPREYGGLSPLEREQMAGVTTQRASWFLYEAFDFAGESLFAADCDGEACLVALLIGVVLLSILASAAIPHFWVVATMVLLTFMAVVALRELLYREGYH